MSDENIQQTQDAAREAVEKDVDIQQTVRDITLKALTERQLDKEGIKAVIGAVTTGVTQGVEANKDKMNTSFKQALSGMDEAVAKSAQAAKLAATEAMGKVSDFADHEFKETLSQLENLEDLFIDTVNAAAQQAGKLANESFRDLTSHLKNSGSDAGRQAKEAAEQLRQQLTTAGKEGMEAAMKAGKQAGNQIAQIASGILAGMADALKK
ncbi:MAG: hypothetical protein OEZ43_13125 [Gammaproteobacteria bacterium]|nr:hypothetical protein [Gammaproteobacteria bacterium]